MNASHTIALIDVFSILALALFALLGVPQQTNPIDDTAKTLYAGELWYITANLSLPPSANGDERFVGLPSPQFAPVVRAIPVTIAPLIEEGVAANVSEPGSAELLLDPQAARGGLSIQLYLADLDNSAEESWLIDLAIAGADNQGTIPAVQITQEDILEVLLSSTGQMTVANLTR